MTHQREAKLVNHFNERAATTALAGVAIGGVAWYTGFGALAGLLAEAFAAYYWWLSARLQTHLANHPHRGAKLKIKFGYPSVSTE